MKTLQTILIITFFLFIASISFTSSNDLNQDLGRHLKLGEIIVATKQIPQTNLFSYTNPTFPFINHHWLSEVIFYLTAKHFGLSSLIMMKFIFVTLAIAIMIKLSLRGTDVLPTIASATLLTPLLLERLDIRPELFGYLFFSLLVYIIFQYKEKPRLLYCIPFIMLLWINLHITFIFGILIVMLLILRMWFYEKDKKRAIILTVITTMALLLNPHGIKGVIYPFVIFGNYGYTIVENQNLFFLSQVTSNPFIKYFFILSPIILVTLCILLWNKKWLSTIILTIFYCAAWYQIRHFPFFVLAAIPPTSYALSELPRHIKIKPFYYPGSIIALIIVHIMVTFLFILNVPFRVFDKDKQIGLEVKSDYKKAIRFMKEKKLPGPIFNNFDIGGYLIYRLYPEYRVFVDNRPEAYPANFMQNVYVRMQEKPELRDEIFKKYGIQTIIMSHTDQTPWAQKFLQDIVKEKQWHLVYADYTMVIFTLDTTLADQRNNEIYWEKQIYEEDDYLNLLKFSQFLALLQKENLVQQAVMKAQRLNPSSCAIKRLKVKQLFNTPFMYQTGEANQLPWYCL